MSGISFGIALSALNAAQTALSVAGNNLANAATPGYSRQRVGLDPASALINNQRYRIGRGVDVATIERFSDSLLLDRIRNQESEVGRYRTLSGHYRQLESLLGEPGPNGLGSVLGSFFADASGLTAAPEDPARRTGLIQSGRAVADGFRSISEQVGSLAQSLAGGIAAEVSLINGLTSQLANVNDTLARSGYGAANVPLDLLDQQDQILRQLGEHLDVRAVRETDGRVSVFSGGNVLVTPRGSVELQTRAIDPAKGVLAVRSPGATKDLAPRSGSLKAYLDLAEKGLQEHIGGIDTLARNLILETNRVHSTGVPLGGGYKSLESRNFFRDANGNGSPLDDALSTTNLPFDVRQGTLTINVSDTDKGTMSQHSLAISPNMTVGQLVDGMNAIPGLTAAVDPLGQLRITALGGKRFDFSNRVQTNPDQGNTFGPAQATITGTLNEPFNLSAGGSFTVAPDGTAPQTVNLNPAQFANPTQATAQEVAAAINSQITGGIAEVSDGRLVIRSNQTGSAGTLQLADGAGSPLSLLGMSTALETGSVASAGVTLNGAFGGAEDLNLTFVPQMAGTIGSTPGLLVDVFDASGTRVTTLDVGSTYTPGTELELADGVSISFSGGQLDPASGDRFETRLIADSDSSDILVAAGLGGFFVGTDARSMDVDPALLANPDMFAAALGGSPGDNRNLLTFAGIYENASDDLDGKSPDDFYRLLLTEIGSETARSNQTLETQEILLSSLDARREEISGVNVDEELLEIEKFQQLYSAAARFLQTMQEVNDVLINL